MVGGPRLTVPSVMGGASIGAWVYRCTPNIFAKKIYYVGIYT
jgi:hypothetical protein